MTCDLTVVIVSWNCREMLRTCLDHLFASRTEFRYKVVVVDNESADGTPELVEREFPQAKLVRSGANLGFARGNNLGFDHVEGRYAMLLNPDAFLTDRGLLQAMVAWLDANPAFGVAGCKLTFPDGGHQVGDAGYRPTATAMICSALGMNRLSSRLRGVFLGDRRSPDRAPIEVDWLCGAFMLIRADVLSQVGGFDERFFMYAEDVEWGCRARSLDFRLAYLPWLSLVHVQNGAQYKDGRAPISTAWLNNLVLLYRRLGKRSSWGLVRFCMTFGFFSRAVIYGLAALLGGRPRLGNKARAMLVFARHTWSLER